MRINNVNNSSPAFNGYIGRNVYAVINRAAKNSVNEIVNSANAKKQVVEGYKLSEITNKRTKLLEKLKNYMEPFHPETYMDVDNSGNFSLRNKKLNINKILSFDHQPGLPKKGFYIDYTELNAKHIDDINEAADVFIRTYEANVTNTLFFDSYAQNCLDNARNLSLFGRIKTFFTGKKLDRLAQEFGVEGGWKNKLKEVQIDAKKESALKKIINKIDKNEEKEIIKNNNKMAENIF